METVSAAPAERIADLYRARTPRSRELWERGRRVMPQGVTANLKYFAPYPVTIEWAEGGRVRDLDRNAYVDLTFGAGPHLLGHRHRAVDAAARAQLDRVLQHLVPTPGEVELAERLAARYPQLERVRFATTGSEAMRNAIRVARAATGRTLVGKLEGHYHGSDDVVLHSSKTGHVEGPPDRPQAVPDAAGLSPAARGEVLLLPWNDAPAAVRLIEERASELACVVLEPIGFSSAGAVPTEREFAAAVREVTARHGVSLIFDEIVTAHRLGPGGAARYLGVEPDLSAFGKAIGGGFPIAAFGGRADLMEETLGEPSLTNGKRVFASGTFTANALAVAASLAVLDVLEADDPAPRLDRLAERLRDGLDKRFAAAGIEACAVGGASISQVHFSARPPRDRRGILAGDLAAQETFLLGMVAEGVLWPPVHSALTCAAHDEADIDRVLDAAERVIAFMAA
ncbi:MAG TPA: aminotransferase class III-fold pyridoxal phosphate-dependent enzyme [Candidatus Dormibacteraeota bacterium]|nr:aminotransferase class III-fold pyridoxal phosphate-dependent enzyme [Candidatus Dormibacteraeota bacterium]